MKPGFLAPAGTLEKKPPHGQPCNSCGLCCVATLCPLGKLVFGRTLGPCPALSYEGEQSRCGLVVSPAAHAPLRLTIQHGAAAMGKAASYLIGSGTGCDARFNGEPADQDFYARLREYDRTHRVEVKAAKRCWGIA